MAGYSKMYVVGRPGGFMGADGVNHIECLILVGDASRQWLAPHYLDTEFGPIGKMNNIVPAGPDHPDALLDACIAFCPWYFKSCSSMAHIEARLKNVKRLDFDARPEEVPREWATLREEARPIFAQIPIWRADLHPMHEI